MSLKYSVKLLLCLIFIFLLSILTAQELLVDESLPTQSSLEQPSVNESVAKDKAPRRIEEITVVGQQSLARFNRLIVEKQDQIFAFFNENNSSDKFDIICKREKKIGSHITYRVCEPKFLRVLRVEKTRDARMGFGMYLNQRELVEEAGQEYEQLQNEMTEMMRTHKEYSDALADLTDLSENYESHRIDYFSKD